MQDAQEELLWNVVEMERSVKIFMNVEGRLPSLLFLHGKRSLLFGRGAPRWLLGALCVVPFTSTSHRECVCIIRNCIFHQVLRSRLPSLNIVSEQRAAADHF